MPVAPSFQDLLDQFKAEAQARQAKLQFIAGDITVAQQHGAAAIGDAALRFMAKAFKETFIDGAEGSALSTLVNDHLDIQRNQANKAQVVCVFSRTTGGAAGTIPLGTQVGTTVDPNGDTVIFLTDANIIVPIADNGPFNISCTAQETGQAGNVAVGTITRVIDQPTFDPNFSVSNAAVAAGGNEEESDDDLRERARAFFSTLRRGTLEAIETGAKTVASVTIATAVEDQQNGIVTVRVTDSSGNSNQQMINDVIDALEGWRAAGTVVQVVGGVASTIDMGITLTVASGFSTSARSVDLISAVTNRINKTKVGETLFLDSLIGALVAVAPDDILDVTFDTITKDAVAQTIGDIIPATNEVLRAGSFTVA